MRIAFIGAVRTVSRKMNPAGSRANNDGNSAAREVWNDPELLLANGLAAVDEMARQAHANGRDLDLVVLPELSAHAPNGPRSAAAQTVARGGPPIVAAPWGSSGT